MKNKIIILIIFMFFLNFCSGNRFSLIENHKYQLKINRKLATLAQKQNLWKEAVFRWKRVIELNSNDYKAHNNLAVAYEATGEYTKAEKEYKIALKLSNNNEFIKRNYESFKAMLQGKYKKPKRGKNAFKRKL